MICSIFPARKPEVGRPDCQAETGIGLYEGFIEKLISLLLLRNPINNINPMLYRTGLALICFLLSVSAGAQKPYTMSGGELIFQSAYVEKILVIQPEPRCGSQDIFISVNLYIMILATTSVCSRVLV